MLSPFFTLYLQRPFWSIFFWKRSLAVGLAVMEGWKEVNKVNTKERMVIDIILFITMARGSAF